MPSGRKAAHETEWALIMPAKFNVATFQCCVSVIFSDFSTSISFICTLCFRLFVDEKIKQQLAHGKRKIQLRKIDNCEGVKIVLGQIPCVFEFQIYKFNHTQALPNELTDQQNKNNPSDEVLTETVRRIRNLPSPPNDNEETCITCI